MKFKKIIRTIAITLLLCAALCSFACAAETDVSAVVEQTWTAAVGQIKNVVNNVVFPALDLSWRWRSSANSGFRTSIVRPQRRLCNFGFGNPTGKSSSSPSSLGLPEGETL